MNQSFFSADRVLDQIPEPQVVREQLSLALRAAAILRRVLPIAVEAAKERSELRASPSAAQERRSDA
jgi:hypothetical protein